MQLTAAGERTEERLNILLIVSDDQGYGDYAAYGNPFLRTPNLDRLKRESAVAERFYTAPLCAPTRAALQSGRHQFRTGVWDTWKGRANMATDEISIAEHLKAGGYRTALFGKWHLGDNIPFRPQDQGFEETFVWVNTDRFAPQFTTADGAVVQRNDFLDDAIASEAVEFLRENRSKPFFAQVAFYCPHDHFKKRIHDKYVERFEQFEDMPEGDRIAYAMIENLDENVGRLLSALEELDLEHNTLVVYFSDNGPTIVQTGTSQPLRYNCGLRGGKGSVFEGGIRTPAFFRLPGVLKPRSVSEKAAVIDILPTLLEFAGMPDSKQQLDGLSLYPLLTGETDHLPARYLFQQQQPQRSGLQPQPETEAVVIGDGYKLVYTGSGAATLLFDLEKDPGETTDIAASNPDLVLGMAAAYRNWFAEVTKGQDFRAMETILGSSSQEVINLPFTQFSDEDGFPLRVVAAGTYAVVLTEVQHHLFPDGGSLGLTDGTRVWSRPVGNSEKDSIRFAMDLEEGSLKLFPWWEGKVPEKFKYGNEDAGFRRLTITPVDN